MRARTHITRRTPAPPLELAPTKLWQGCPRRGTATARMESSFAALLCGNSAVDEPSEDDQQQASSSTNDQLSSALGYITGTSDEPASPFSPRNNDWPEAMPRASPWPLEASPWAADDEDECGVCRSPPRRTVVAATARSPSDPRSPRRGPPSPVEPNVRSAERRFLDEFLVMLADGFKMRKYGRRGSPKERLVRLDGDMIVWNATRPSFRFSERGGVAVADITDVRRSFAQRKPSHVPAGRCLSLTTTHRSVDLELPDNEAREFCHDGFSLLVKFGAPPSNVDPPGRPRAIPPVDHAME